MSTSEVNTHWKLSNRIRESQRRDRIMQKTPGSFVVPRGNIDASKRPSDLRTMIAEVADPFGEKGYMFSFALDIIVRQSKGSGLSKRQFAKIFYDQAIILAPQVIFPKLSCKTISIENVNTNGIILALKDIINQHLKVPDNSKEMLAKLLRIKAILLWIEK
jgi:hypothetical protein